MTVARRVRTGLLSFSGNLALACVSIAIAFLLAEGVIRVGAPQQLVRVRPDIWMPVDTFGWAHRPNLNTTINTGEGTVRVITDREGYRVRAEGRLAADRSILVLGDSYMAAMQVEYEESIPGLLESSLWRHGVPVSVRNTGVGSWDPVHYLLRARHALARERFDLVLVFLYLGNDIVAKVSNGYPARELLPQRSVRLPRRLSHRELIEAILYPVNEWLEAHSHLFVFAKQRGRVLLMRAGLTAREDPLELRVSEAKAARWGVTADLCATIAAEAARYGTPTMFVFLPASYQVDRREFEDYLRGFNLDERLLDIDQPNRIMLRELRARGLEVMDPTPALRAAHAAGTRMHGRVDPHFSAAAHALVASLLEPVLLEAVQSRPSGARISRR